MIDFLTNYWFILILAVCAVAVGIYTAYTFIKMPSHAQLIKVKEWLLYAVTAAEKELGGGTGQIKLRYVYDMFIVKFPYLVKFISFESFSHMVDEVLERFRDLLNNNDNLQSYVEKE